MKKIEENSVELWAIDAEKKFKANLRPMTSDEARVFGLCLINENCWDGDLTIKEELENNKFPVPYSCVFWNRVRSAHTYTVSIATAVFIGVLADSFGDVTIYVNYLQYQAFRKGQRYINMNFFVRCFPNGFPTKDALKDVWDSQKLDSFGHEMSDNMLDYLKAQHSISFKD